MKTLQEGILLLVFLMSLSMYSQQTDWKQQDLKGKVKSVELISYAAGEKFGKVTKLGILGGEQNEFNENGLVIQKKLYGKGGLPIKQMTYQYDTVSNLIAQNVFDKKGALVRKILREYNQFNKITFESIYGADGILLSRSIFEYKDGVIPKKILTYNKKGVQINLQEFKYDKKSAAKSIATTNPKSKMIEKVEKYDLHKNLTHIYQFDVEGNLKSSVVYTYDTDNNLIESKFIDKGKLLVHRILKYNDLGFLIEVSVSYPEKEKTDHITYQYDFDEQSNWTRAVEYVNSIPVQVKERKIIYY